MGLILVMLALGLALWLIVVGWQVLLLIMAGIAALYAGWMGLMVLFDLLHLMVGGDPKYCQILRVEKKEK